MVRDELGAALKGSQVEPLYGSLSQMGVIHSLVIDALSKTDSDRHLRNVLNQMRRQRDCADYRIGMTRNWDQDIADLVLMADTILQNRSSLKPSFTRKMYDIENLIIQWHARIAAKP